MSASRKNGCPAFLRRTPMQSAYAGALLEIEHTFHAGNLMGISKCSKCCVERRKYTQFFLKFHSKQVL